MSSSPQHPLAKDLEENFFYSGEPEKIFIMQPNWAYLNSAAINHLKKQGGKYIDFKYNPANQTFKIKAKRLKSHWRQLMYAGKSGCSLNLYNRFIDRGMRAGRYLYIGDDIYQHVDNILSS